MGASLLATGRLQKVWLLCLKLLMENQRRLLLEDQLWEALVSESNGCCGSVSQWHAAVFATELLKFALHSAV